MRGRNIHNIRNIHKKNHWTWILRIKRAVKICGKEGDSEGGHKMLLIKDCSKYAPFSNTSQPT